MFLILVKNRSRQNVPSCNLVGRYRAHRFELPGAARFEMVGVRKSRSHLIAVCVIQNILNLNVALLFIRIIGQRASDLIRELIRRIPGSSETV